jgi:hypothetical protein
MSFSKITESDILRATSGTATKRTTASTEATLVFLNHYNQLNNPALDAIPASMKLTVRSSGSKYTCEGHPGKYVKLEGANDIFIKDRVAVKTWAESIRPILLAPAPANQWAQILANNKPAFSGYKMEDVIVCLRKSTTQTETTERFEAWVNQSVIYTAKPTADLVKGRYTIVVPFSFTKSDAHPLALTMDLLYSEKCPFRHDGTIFRSDEALSFNAVDYDMGVVARTTKSEFNLYDLKTNLRTTWLERVSKTYVYCDVKKEVKADRTWIIIKKVHHEKKMDKSRSDFKEMLVEKVFAPERVEQMGNLYTGGDAVVWMEAV